jgi:hypothetical protein
VRVEVAGEGDSGGGFDREHLVGVIRIDVGGSRSRFRAEDGKISAIGSPGKIILW